MNTFSDLELVSPLRKALSEQNYKIPTPIQAKTIPHALEGRDILGCAQTGTGKTAAFALPIINQLVQAKSKLVPKSPQTLILSPTRELAVQIGESFETYGRHLSLRHTLAYGGVSQNPQVRALKRGVHILIATPGRLIDLMGQGHIKLNRLKFFTLDEVDRMLDMGFLPDIKRVIRELPEERQSLFFSATLPPEIRSLAKQLLRAPYSVNISPKSPTVNRIEQQLHFVDNSNKQKKLQEILSEETVEQTVVFTNTKRKANTIAEKLKRSGFGAVAVHGNKSQNARQSALNAFQDGRFQVLVATDVAARGIDIQGISHVINFDLPKEPEGYVHRIGRTGRAGESGIAISFCTSNERRELRAIERLIGKQIPTKDRQGKIQTKRSLDSEVLNPSSEPARTKSPVSRRRKTDPRGNPSSRGKHRPATAGARKKRRFRTKTSSSSN